MRGDFTNGGHWFLSGSLTLDRGARLQKATKPSISFKLCVFLFREIRFSFVFFCLHDFWVADGGAQAQQNQFVGDLFLPDI